MTTTPDTNDRLAEIQQVTIDLPATERCSRCDAQAYVEVEMPSKFTLLFCAHHYNEHETSLVQQAHRIIDHRPALNMKEQEFTGINER